ncbi:MAG: bifunctional DNA-binding transcriptional regulator/O6-methylguanine-DNA methyltransferase Ada [Herpetosiphonaceae bacterium]|nr:bifunctional DNA-binding transcriptional regulator/O6-methylguanine-DNA methyltransferase Ada [Herpetosiphonaceae bacterium]
MSIDPLLSNDMSKASDEQRWHAVLAHDQEADGRFVYAVRSTGIFCRPSCASRRPQREQVLFFEQPALAEAQGFRACRRCHPSSPLPPEPQLAFVEQACSYINEHLDAPLTLATLGAVVGLSPHHLQRTFKRVMGITPRQYAAAQRLRAVKQHIKQEPTVTAALYEAGYGSSSRLYEQVHDRFGMTPRTYRQGGTGMHIRYTITACPLGRLLVAATERGICEVSLGDSDALLEQALHTEYPAVDVVRDDGSLDQWVVAILKHLQGEQPHLDLPLDLQATAFQWRVWELLRAIPYGSTRSYGEVARTLGQPTAARAVARACATNPVALLIPCHRVVREGGELGGYRWNVERKRALLAQEAQQQVEEMEAVA